MTSRYTYQCNSDVVNTLVKRLVTSENLIFINIDVIFFILRKNQQQNNPIYYFSMSIIEKIGFLSNENITIGYFRCRTVIFMIT